MQASLLIESNWLEAITERRTCRKEATAPGTRWQERVDNLELPRLQRITPSPVAQPMSASYSRRSSKERC